MPVWRLPLIPVKTLRAGEIAAAQDPHHGGSGDARGCV